MKESPPRDSKKNEPKPASIYTIHFISVSKMYVNLLIALLFKVVPLQNHLRKHTKFVKYIQTIAEKSSSHTLWPTPHLFWKHLWCGFTTLSVGTRKKGFILGQEWEFDQDNPKNSCPLLYRLTDCLVFKGSYKTHLKLYKVFLITVGFLLACNVLHPAKWMLETKENEPKHPKWLREFCGCKCQV